MTSTAALPEALVAFMYARLAEQPSSDSAAADLALLGAYAQAGNIAQDDQYDDGFTAGVQYAIRCRALTWRQHPGYLREWAP